MKRWIHATKDLQQHLVCLLYIEDVPVGYYARAGEGRGARWIHVVPDPKEAKQVMSPDNRKFKLADEWIVHSSDGNRTSIFIRIPSDETQYDQLRRAWFSDLGNLELPEDVKISKEFIPVNQAPEVSFQVDQLSYLVPDTPYTKDEIWTELKDVLKQALDTALSIYPDLDFESYEESKEFENDFLHTMDTWLPEEVVSWPLQDVLLDGRRQIEHNLDPYKLLDKSYYFHF